MQKITVTELKNKIAQNDDFILLDVRSLEEFEDGHLDNALLLDVRDFSEKALDELNIKDKQKEIVVYCRSGSRSAFASQILESWGFEKVLDLENGLIYW